MIDSGNRDEPPTRYFGSLDAAYRALDELGDKWRPFAWVSEQKPDGGRFVHMRNGRSAVT
jgi:hypothetical protein